MRKSQAPSARLISPVVNRQISVLSDKPKLQNVQSSDDKIRFNVLIGKKSTKKHKTWDTDGILEIQENNAVLKDDSGTIIGRLPSIKRELFIEGYIFSIGNKEIQIIDLNQESHNTIEKRKQPITIQPKALIKKPKILPLSDNKRITMPQPTDEHRWHFNEHFLPVNDVYLDAFLEKVLRPHQIDGIKFLYECLMSYRNLNYSGAILADEMGLGKTLQCISVIWILLKQGPYGNQPILKRILIITPSSLVDNWYKEFNRWLGKERIHIYKVDLKNKPSDFIRTPIPILIISYEMFLRYTSDFESILFDLVVCDEGHRLKNDQNKTYITLNQIPCKKRLILTGTPIQNDLQEFFTLVNFVNNDILGSYSEYKRYFEQIIYQSQEKNADPDLQLLGKQRNQELQEKTNFFILRRTQQILDKYLPTKTDLIVLCKPTKLQIQLYQIIIDYWFRNKSDFTNDIKHLSILTMLRKTVNHPKLLLKSDQSDDLTKQIFEILQSFNNIDSGKINVLKGFLKHFHQQQSEKVVIVSNYTQTLDLIADICLEQEYTYCRLDGTTATNQRLDIVQKFNQTTARDCYAFLLSAKAGGVGLNLIGASRLVLFDNDWNPAVDVQAMARIWRDGQRKSVYLYRFLTTGTIDEKILQRQLNKINLSGTVMNEQCGPQKESIKFTDEELKDIFSLNLETNCLIHSQLNCNCNNENNENQLDSCIGIDQLINWEHYNNPINEGILKEIGLSTTPESITFLFKNKSPYDN